MGLSERRRREREGRRTAILAAATRVIADRGFGGASMDAIAAEAELGKATLYYYFGTKDDLARAVVQQATEQLFAGLAEGATTDGDLADAVEALLHAFARFADGDPGLLVVVAPSLSRMHLSWASQRGRRPDPGTPAHDAFLDRLDDLVQRSAWAGRSEALYDLLGDVLVVMCQLFLVRSPEQALSRIPFYVDLIRRWTPGDDR